MNQLNIANEQVTQMNKQRYLGSIYNSGEIEEEATNSIKVRWLKWQSTSAILCDKCIPLTKNNNSIRQL